MINKKPTKKEIQEFRDFINAYKKKQALKAAKHRKEA
jgi:hypothetical protein